MTKKQSKTSTSAKTKRPSKPKMKTDTIKSKSAAQDKEKDKEAVAEEKIQETTVDSTAPGNGKTDEEIAKLEAGVSEWKDRYLRLSAEFDNYRKRTLKEKSDLVKVANEDLLKDILPVVDDFERGMANMDKSENVDALKQGVHLIHTKFIEFLRQKGIREIEASGKEFDIDYHEAITKIPAPSEDLKGKVVDVIEKGYLLNEKVIRYVKVVVGE